MLLQSRISLPLHCGHFEAVNCCGSCPVHCLMFSSIFGLCSLDANSNPWSWQKYLKTSLLDLGGGVEAECLSEKLKCPKFIATSLSPFENYCVLNSICTFELPGKAFKHVRIWSLHPQTDFISLMRPGVSIF